MLLILVIIIFLTIMIYHSRQVLWQLIIPILWAVIFTYLLNPIVHLMDRKGISRLWSVVILYTVIIAVITLLSITITPKIIKEARHLVELLPKYTNEANEYIYRLYEKIEQLDNLSPQMAAIRVPIEEYLIGVQYRIIDYVNNTTRGVFGIFSHVVNIVLIPIYAFYFLKDTDYFKKKLTMVIPKVYRQDLIHIFKDIDKLLGKFIRGQLIVAACVGILNTLALLIIKVNFAFLIGMIAGISNIIPYIGPIIGAIPAVIIALLDEPSKAIWVIIAFTIIQQIESAILSPKIVGESVGLHPIVIIITLIVGNHLYGVIGMLFGIPIVASIKIVLKHITNHIIRAG